MYYLFTTIFYLLYIQFSPTMGNIWIRNGHFAPYNALRLILYPLIDYKMWVYPSMWGINYFIWIIICYYLIFFTRLLSSGSLINC